MSTRTLGSIIASTESCGILDPMTSVYGIRSATREGVVVLRRHMTAGSHLIL